ncbi:hypothetical protein K8P10_002987 [Leucobacter sp. Psy1]|uniref:hypothetical protein n=1 Tax=Leucobacter sp. Psy1 TaxID=2875729 RepID=UPI001CD3D1D7|nr:hypothetical protein [Leucobacter sp. Psy1]UBH07476.1 hypothetical protein K8P10_002987 [Leucobacter sp. Psy1]
MTTNSIPLEDAETMVLSSTQAARKARRATRWFRVFIVLQAAYAFAFTLAIDVAEVPYWQAFAPLMVATISIWMIACLYRQTLPRYGLRNMGIAVATWFALYTLMFDPALQLLNMSSPWWWVLAGVVAITPMLACLFVSSRR